VANFSEEPDSRGDLWWRGWDRSFRLPSLEGLGVGKEQNKYH